MRTNITSVADVTNGNVTIGVCGQCLPELLQENPRLVIIKAVEVDDDPAVAVLEVFCDRCGYIWTSEKQPVDIVETLTRWSQGEDIGVSGSDAMELFMSLNAQLSNGAPLPDAWRAGPPAAEDSPRMTRSVVEVVYPGDMIGVNAKRINYWAQQIAENGGLDVDADQRCRPMEIRTVHDVGRAADGVTSWGSVFEPEDDNPTA